MEKIRLNNTDYVTQIGYNAKGQRLLVAFGNGMMTRYVYDSATFRLLRLRSEKFTLSGNTYSSAGSVAQDTAYSYDAVGNILQTLEATTGCGIGGTDTLLRNFSYDSLYRLLSATGRENAPIYTPFWNDSYRSEDKAITTAYSQHFSYDKVGNILQLQHIGNNNFTRNFNYNNQNNQLQSIAVGQNTFAFSYDANGNVVSETSSRMAEFDYANRMRSFKVIASGSITQYTHYLYDGAGNRVKKLTITGSNYDSTTYIDGLSEYRTDGSATQLLLHITDGEMRIASVRSGDAFGDTTPAIKYMLSDHLNSVGVELNTNGGAVSREEYYAYGETSFGSYAKKRYRYCGKEKDTESGYYFYNARYYNAWTCKFTAVDPLAGKYAHQSSYCYADCNPVMKNDPSGMGTDDPEATPENNNSSNTTNVAETDQIETFEAEVDQINEDYKKYKHSLGKKKEDAKNKFIAGIDNLIAKTEQITDRPVHVEFNEKMFFDYLSVKGYTNNDSKSKERQIYHDGCVGITRVVTNSSFGNLVANAKFATYDEAQKSNPNGTVYSIHLFDTKLWKAQSDVSSIYSSMKQIYDNTPLKVQYSAITKYNANKDLTEEEQQFIDAKGYLYQWNSNNDGDYIVEANNTINITNWDIESLGVNFDFGVYINPNAVLHANHAKTGYPKYDPMMVHLSNNLDFSKRISNQEAMWGCHSCIGYSEFNREVFGVISVR